MDRVVKEAIRYLGYGRQQADERTLEMIAEGFRELERVSSPRHISRILDLEVLDTEYFRVGGGWEVKSHSLSRNLKGCDRIVLFGATLGIGVDRLLARSARKDMAMAVVLQACAAALLEEYCDECQRNLAQELQQEGYYLRPRFSPGYGDFAIDCQKILMQMLDCAKTIGLTMTDSFMMTPAKSVTAVLGASRTEEKCHIHGCEACSKKDCAYRRDTK